MDYRDSLAENRDSRRRREDHKNMKVFAYFRGDAVEVWVVAKYEVCHGCNGRGSYVNPGIDSNGITGEEMYELGSDFEESYMSGVYDVECAACDGRRVELVPDESRMSAEDLKLRDAWLDREAGYAAEDEMERRMGA